MHLGQTKTKLLVGEWYYWKNWRIDINHYLDNYMVCKQNMT
jgi:hypothetical protein